MVKINDILICACLFVVFYVYGYINLSALLCIDKIDKCLNKKNEKKLSIQDIVIMRVLSPEYNDVSVDTNNANNDVIFVEDSDSESTIDAVELVNRNSLQNQPMEVVDLTLSDIDSDDFNGFMDSCANQESSSEDDWSEDEGNIEVNVVMPSLYWCEESAMQRHNADVISISSESSGDGAYIHGKYSNV